MNYDKRKGEQPVPESLSDYLNESQMAALHTIENFGWKLMFVRRPVFQEPVIIVVNGDGSQIGVLEEDGRLNLEANIQIRQ